MKGSKGMSFVELSVVILLLFVLTLGWLYLFGDKTLEARDASRIERIHSLEAILLDVFVTEGKYPNEAQFDQILSEYRQFEDPLVGQNRCLDGAGEVTTCHYEYVVGNAGFDYVLVTFFEEEEYASQYYSTLSWMRQEFAGYIVSTQKGEL